MFGYNTKKLMRLISTDRYKNSKYKIQKINGYYVLAKKHSNQYVDLISSVYTWPMSDRFYEDCKGTISAVINAFNEKVPIIEEIKTLKTY